MKMYSLYFGHTGSISVIADSIESAIESFNKMKKEYPMMLDDLDYSKIIENKVNECFINFADE